MGLEERVKRLEQRMQPKPKPPQLVSEDTRRALDAIAAARHEDIISHGEPLDEEGLTDFLIGRGVSPETAPGYVTFIAQRWPGGADG